MRPNATSVVILLGSLSLAQAAAHRRDGFVVRPRARGEEALEKRQAAAAAQTVTVFQTLTVGSNNTVTVTVTAAGAAANAVASTVTVTNCAPGVAQGAASGVGSSVAASASLPAAGGAAAGTPAAAAPGNPGVPSGGIGVVIVSIPDSLRTKTKSVAAAVPTAVQNPAVGSSTLAALPGSASLVGSSSLQAISSVSSLSTSLQALPSQGAAGALQPLPAAGSSAAALQPLPGATTTSSILTTTSAGGLQPLPANTGLAPPPGGIIPPASGLDSTLNLGGMAPTPIAAGPDGAFGGQLGEIPLPASGVSAGPPQAAIDPAATITPGVAQAGAEVVNIDVSGLTLNSQLNLGNLAQATVVSATK
ncbi:hypothetical protein QBC47DRAFT_211980 [Echria macrotheca]|uniref:Uncharacterized protein n=1 Tax=Echria macrotheca TaxID=438768 RepID=A0AAJ0BCB1_9PEZI|nr:hypothetical protein QBC47DRAFT_211980 [Echria macrotheca]